MLILASTDSGSRYILHAEHFACRGARAHFLSVEVSFEEVARFCICVAPNVHLIVVYWLYVAKGPKLPSVRGYSL